MSNADKNLLSPVPEVRRTPRHDSTDAVAQTETVVGGRNLFREAFDFPSSSDKAEAEVFSTPFVPPPEEFAVLVSRAVIVPYQPTAEGHLIWSITAPLRSIIQRIMKEPSLMYTVDHRKWEEIIAATYDESGLFDEVILTPRSGDRGRDVIAVKNGFGSVRLIESVKRYTPGPKHRVTAEEVQALLGVLMSDPQASKGIVSTTWEFAPMIWENPQITQYIPHRLELVDGKALVKRLAEYTIPKGR